MNDKKAHIKFDILSAETIEEDEFSQFSLVKVHAFSSGWNKHNYFCSEEVLISTADSIYYKPIVYSFSKLFRDLDTHTDPDKSLIAGFVVPDSLEFNKLEDGRLGMFVLARIWKRYAPQFVQLLKESSGHKKISVEMELNDKKEFEDGEEMLSFEYSAICVLGDLITEASPGSHLQVLSFAKEQEEYDKALALEFAGMYEELDFKIPTSVKNNAKRGLELRKEYGRGSTSVGLATARYLIKNETATPEKVRRIAKYFPRHAGDNLDDKTSNGWISWLIWGGNSGRSWATNLIKKMDDIDQKDMSYFSEKSETITFPYKKETEMNPALKGIKPPISLEQANAIAKQADAIGNDEDKNGWAIAISNFKKTHTVKEEKWVRKEKELNMEDLEKNAMNEEEFEDKKEEEKTPEVEEMASEEIATEEKEKFESDEEESEEKEEESEEEEKSEEMSLDANLDVKAILGFLQNETEDYQKIAAEFAEDKEEKDFAKLTSYMYGRMQEMASKMEEKDKESEAYMAELEDLRKYKKGKEEADFNFAVDSTLKEIETKTEITKSELETLREKSKEFSLENIDVWKNLAKAKGLDFAIKNNSEKKEEEIRYPWVSGGEVKSATTSFWN